MFDIEKARRKGISEDQIAIMAKINENNAKNESCKGHKFNFEHRAGTKYICENCGYEADMNYVVGYHDAVRHISWKNENGGIK